MNIYVGNLSWGLNDQDLAWTLVEDAPHIVRELENRIGCLFDRRPDGQIHQKAFAGQTFDRTVHVADLTGIEIIGPAPCFFSRVNKVYRWHLLLRGTDPAAVLRGLDIQRTWHIDIDPVDVL